MNHTVHYIVSGAGALNDPRVPNLNKIPKKSLKFEWHKGWGVVYGGLGLVKVDKQSMNIKFIRSRMQPGSLKGLNVYETVIYPRK